MTAAAVAREEFVITWSGTTALGGDSQGAPQDGGCRLTNTWASVIGGGRVSVVIRTDVPAVRSRPASRSEYMAVGTGRRPGGKAGMGTDRHHQVLAPPARVIHTLSVAALAGALTAGRSPVPVGDLAPAATTNPRLVHGVRRSRRHRLSGHPARPPDLDPSRPSRAQGLPDAV